MKIHRLLPLTLVFVAACERSPEPQPIPAEPPITSLQEFTETNPTDTRSLWLEASGHWRAALDSSKALQQQLERFLDNPDSDNLNAAQSAWHTTHQQIAAALPFAAISFSNPGLFAELDRIWRAIDIHPVQPGYLDSISGYPFSGIVNDISLRINQQTLREQHGFTDDSEATLGLHVLEFLLWGENAERSYRDFIPQNASDNPDISSVNLPQNRRRDLLRLASVLLVDDLQRLMDAWQDPNSALAYGYFALPDDSRIILWRQAFSVSLQEINNHCVFSAEPCLVLKSTLGTLIDVVDSHPGIAANPSDFNTQATALLAALDGPQTSVDIAAAVAQLQVAFSP